MLSKRLVDFMKSADKTTGKSLVIGLDCSTTGTKAIAFDKKGRIAAAAHASNLLFSPKPGYYEQNALDWWISTSPFQIREKRLFH
jgi:glycerol kinase